MAALRLLPTGAGEADDLALPPGEGGRIDVLAPGHTAEADQGLVEGTLGRGEGLYSKSVKRIMLTMFHQI